MWFVHEHAIVHRGQKRVLDSLELELQDVGSCQMGVLGTKLQISISAAGSRHGSHLSGPFCYTHLNTTELAGLSGHCSHSHLLSSYDPLGTGHTLIVLLS